MPNQRAADKRQFGVTLKKDEVAAIDAAAARLGITRTEFIRIATLEQIKRDAEVEQDKNNK
ncbi:MAG: ribbon-helix-helix protein, CopG family [Akkermansia sp.]